MAKPCWHAVPQAEGVVKPLDDFIEYTCDQYVHLHGRPWYEARLSARHRRALDALASASTAYLNELISHEVLPVCLQSTRAEVRSCEAALSNALDAIDEELGSFGDVTLAACQQAVVWATAEVAAARLHAVKEDESWSEYLCSLAEDVCAEIGVKIDLAEDMQPSDLDDEDLDAGESAEDALDFIRQDTEALKDFLFADVWVYSDMINSVVSDGLSLRALIVESIKDYFSST